MAMEGQPFSLEELIDDATEISNHGSNDAKAQAVANQVNRTIGGPSSAVKLLIQKLQQRQEVVTLQALNVVEVCVKNCGVNFHNEVGKYKFINELIKLLSSKYDGDITPASVKERVVNLMFSWYVGLPQQQKIAEAYKMLKQQGIIKKDPVDPNRTEFAKAALTPEGTTQPTVDPFASVGEQPPPRETENTAFSDEGNSQLLQTLLSSKDPNDLHSANKLIKTMVKQEEERLDRVSKRIQVLETVTNNVKLLDDMIAKHDPNASTTTDESNVELMNELYERCLTLRPELFRLASKNVEEKDDSVGDILLASDELTRVIDSYKEKVLFKAAGSGVGDKVPSASSSSQIPTAESSNSLCLLDLSLDSPTAPSQVMVEQNGVSVAAASSQSSLLNDQFKLLGLDTPNGVDIPPLPSGMANGNSAMYPMAPVNTMNPVMSNATPPLNNNFPVQSFSAPSLAPSASASASVEPVAPSNSTATAAKKKDLLDFDIFDSDFLGMKPTEKTETTTTGQSLDSLAGLNAAPTVNPIQSGLNAAPLGFGPTFPSTAANAGGGSGLLQPAMNSVIPIQPSIPQQPIAPVQPSVAPLPSKTPLQQAPTQTPPNYLVPLEALKTGAHEPIAVLDKDGVKTFLLIAEDTRPDANPNVVAAVLSTISLNTKPLTEFNIQVAVPKVMRVKLQPPSANQLAPFNPLGAPPSISQIMLIANPTKEAVKLRFKITYSVGGVVHVETANVDHIPVA